MLKFCGQSADKWLVVERDRKIRVALYTQHPFIARGVATVLHALRDLELAACRETLSGTLESLKSKQPDVLLIHLLSGISLTDLREIRAADSRCQIVLWGDTLEGEFTFQAMQLGVRCVLPGYTSIEDFVAAVRNVHKGVACFESNLLERMLAQKRVALTQRQGQIVSLVAQGLKNKQIAFLMGITEGTVKVYLYKLFKKLGLNDRLDMALYARNNFFSGPSSFQNLRNAAPPQIGRGNVSSANAAAPAAKTAAAKVPMPRSVLLLARKQPGTPVVH